MDEGTDTERYTFKTQAQKIVYPTNSFAIKCFYNDTQFSADLYTRKPKTLPSGNTPSPSSTPLTITSTTGSNAAYVDWEFAVDARQSIGGGVDVPDCYEFDRNQIGAKLTQGFEEQSSSDFCNCAYTNYER